MAFKLICCPVVDSFQCACSKCTLKTATLTMATIEIIATIIQIVWSSSCLLESKYTLNSCWFIKGHVELVARRYHFWADSVDLYIPLVAQAAILGFCCLLLFYGANNKKPIYMIPYVMVWYVGMWLLVLMTAISGLNELFTKYITGLCVILGGSTLTVIAWYLWLVKYSYYRTLVEELRQSKAQKDVCPESPVIEEESLT